MKKALVLMVLNVAPTLAFAQGTVVFANSASSPVQQWTSLYDRTLINVPAGGGSVALMATPEGTAFNPFGCYCCSDCGFGFSFSTLASFLAANPGWNCCAVTSILAGGQFDGGVVDIVPLFLPGRNVEYCVIGWTGPYSTLDAAIAGGAFLGMSALATTATGDPTTTPPGTPVNLSDTFHGFTLEGFILSPVGSLTVTIVPPCAAAAGARWSVDGGPPRPSGETVGALEASYYHTVSFSKIGGWITPSNQSVYIGLNATITTIGTYIPKAGPFTYTTDNNTITIKRYTGPGGVVVIPDTIECLPVTTIWASAFYSCTNLTSLRIPNSVTNLGDSAFSDCTNLAGVYFEGNAPGLDGTNVFFEDSLSTVYYLAGATGWGAMFGGRPTALWQRLPPWAWTLSASATTTTGATLNGAVNPNGWPTTAWFQWGATTNYGSLTASTSMGSGTNVLALSAPLAGLTPGVTYHFRIAATNDYGLFYGSDQSFTTFIPATVVTLSATAVAATSAILNGTVNPNGWPTTARFQWGPTTNYGNLSSATGLGSGTNDLPLSAPLTGLSPSVTYHFRIAAANNNGLVYGSDQSFTPSALSPPEVYTLPATAVTASNAVLNGMVNPSGYPTAAWFQWGTTISYGHLTAATDMGSGTNALPVSALVAGVTFGTTYHFRAAATNLAGVVYGSDQSLTALPPPEVRTLSATAVTTNSATLNGTVNPNGRPTVAWFQWGATPNYGYLTPVTDLGSGTIALPLSAPLAGLTSNAIYHFRIAATNDYGLVCGSDQSFATVAVPPGSTFTNWVSLGTGMNYEVMALAVSGTNLYAGGWFTTAGGVAVNRIAKWDGSAWSALGSGMMEPYPLTADVFALAVSGTDLYAGGQFTTAGGVPANNIAKWDGSAWSALGLGINGDYDVEALVVSGTNTYAGGFFPLAGGLPATNIAQWNGSAWSALGSGMNGAGYVWALAVSGTNLYAGGPFTIAGGVTANFIAKWDGRAWSALGSGINNSVAALAVSGNDLYAGGHFTTAGGVTANYIAKWDGHAWSALGSGVDGYVNAMAMDGPNLYAGGWFTTAGGVPANHIAKWDGRAWSALGSGTDGVVGALAADGVGHLFVGGAFGRAGTTLSPFIAQATLGNPPAVLTSPPTQTAEARGAVNLAVDATGDPPPFYQWFLNGTNLLSCTSSNLVLTNILFSQSGSYTVVLTNLYGAVTSAPAMLNVIAAVERRPVPGLQLTGEAGGLLNVDAANPLGSTPDWLPLDTVTLASTLQYYFDLTVPLPQQRFYRAWQTGTPSVLPSLDLHLVPAITLTGSIGGSVQVDAINQVGPIDAWFTLDTVALTNSIQLYFDTSAWGQPPRLYRLVQAP